MMTSEKEKQRMREWYKKNKDHHIKKVKARQKATNYATEKTPKQKKLRSIKRQTRKLYPLIGQYCECGKPATEHHHTTKPITVHDFVFTCHNCHIKFDYEMKNEN